MSEKKKGFFQRLGERWEAVVSKVGGHKEKRNLLGILLDVTAGTVTLPIKVGFGTAKFTGLLFKEPKKAGELALFWATRFKAAGFGLLGVKIWREGGRLKVLFGDHVYILGMTWLFSSVLSPLFFEIASISVAWGTMWWAIGFVLLAGPPIIWVLSGIRPMIEAWRQYHFEDWRQEKQLVEKEARVTAAKQRMSRAEREANLAGELQSIINTNPALFEEMAYQHLEHKKLKEKHDKGVQAAQGNGEAIVNDEQDIKILPKGGE